MPAIRKWLRESDQGEYLSRRLTRIELVIYLKTAQGGWPRQPRIDPNPRRRRDRLALPTSNPRSACGTSETLLAHSHTSALPPFTDMLGKGPDS